MAIEIAGIAFHRVHRIGTLERARLVRHRIPGQQGDVVQNLGRDSVQLQIEGIFYGPQAKDDLEELRSSYLKRAPVDFVADVVGGAYASKVTLDRLDVRQDASEPDQFSYVLIVSEHATPPKTAAPQKIDQKVLADAKAKMKLVTLPDALALGSLPDLTNPFVPLEGALEPVQQASGGLTKAVSGLQELLGA